MSEETTNIIPKQARTNKWGDTTVLRAEKLNKYFYEPEKFRVLKDVSFKVGKGEFVSFIGPSGCGKTTFLRAIAALEHPTGGSLTVNGMTPDEARRKRAYGYVFQAAGLYPWRTIAGNIRLPLEIMGFSKAEQAERTERVLDLVELAEGAIDVRPRQEQALRRGGDAPVAPDELHAEGLLDEATRKRDLVTALVVDGSHERGGHID